MQNWKIKRMSVKRINQWLSAIGKLIKHYEGRVRLGGCPLCPVIRKDDWRGDRCRLCPWAIIEGMECEDFAEELYGHRTASVYRGNLRYKKWKIIRLRQLRNWKQIFKLELARKFE